MGLIVLEEGRNKIIEIVGVHTQNRGQTNNEGGVCYGQLLMGVGWVRSLVGFWVGGCDNGSDY